MARDKPEDYQTFYKNYSKCIKLGVNDETKYKDKLMKLLRYTSSINVGQEDTVSLEEYVGRMKEGQKGIYYITGETDKIIDESPFLEKLKSLGYEVLYMSDPIDEYVMQGTKEYDGKPFIDCARGGKDMNLAEEDEEDEETKEKRETTEKALCKRFQDVLGHQVDAVVIGTRMIDSPCCLVSSEYGWSANMERIMRAQTLRDNSRAEFMTARKIMEVNPRHRIIKELQQRIDSDELASDVINLLYESSLIDSGFSLDTPKRFVKRINNMICLGLSLEEAEPPAKEDEPNVKVEQINDPNIMSELVRKNEIIEKHDRQLEENV